MVRRRTCTSVCRHPSSRNHLRLRSVGILLPVYVGGCCRKSTRGGVSWTGVGKFRIIVGRHRVSNGARWALNPERLCSRDPRRKTDKSDKQTNMVQLSHDSVASLQTCRRKQRPRESPALLGATRKHRGSVRCQC